MKKYVIVLIIGIAILLVPTIVYLCFLIPKMSEAYTSLLASGGFLGFAGYWGTTKIPENIKFSRIFKTAANSFTTLIISILIKDFYMQIIGLVATIIVSVIIFMICYEVYKNGRRKKQNEELATEIARSITETIK